MVSSTSHTIFVKVRDNIFYPSYKETNPSILPSVNGVLFHRPVATRVTIQPLVENWFMVLGSSVITRTVGFSLYPQLRDSVTHLVIDSVYPLVHGPVWNSTFFIINWNWGMKSVNPVKELLTSANLYSSLNTLKYDIVRILAYNLICLPVENSIDRTR